jgi:hypothetical protein
MFDLFKKKQEGTPADVKSLRNNILQFVKNELAKVQGGEGASIKALHLFVTCTESVKHLYETALYANEEGRLKEEIQRIADDFALDLPDNWELKVLFTAEAPAAAIKASQSEVALFIQTKEKTLQKSATAYLKVLQGQAEKELYAITSDHGRINIGREKQVQTRDNFFRINTVAFPAESTHDSNKFISRQHAHVEWDNGTGTFLLFADEGGVPPRNKVKVRPQSGSDPVKLQSTKSGYSLQEGDQIMLGETALLEFRYSPD